MTELEKEATEYALEWGTKSDGTYACCRDGYIAGAEPREKQIEELEVRYKDLEWQFKEVVKDNDFWQEENRRLEKENAELKDRLDFISKNAEPAGKALVDMVKREVEKAECNKYSHDCSRCDKFKEYESKLQKNIMQSETLIKRLLVNRPDTYSGTDVMVNQAKMFAFDSAVKDAVEYLKEVDK